MRLLCLTAVLAGTSVLSAVVAIAETRPETAIQSVIETQIAAFRMDDFEKAFEFAAPAIQDLFGNSERFGVMVRQGYPMVWRPAEVRYLGLRDTDAGMIQQVAIRDRFDTVHYLDYLMTEDAGGWKIAGVVIVTGADLA